MCSIGASHSLIHCCWSHQYVTIVSCKGGLPDTWQHARHGWLLTPFIAASLSTTCWHHHVLLPVICEQFKLRRYSQPACSSSSLPHSTGNKLPETVLELTSQWPVIILKKYRIWHDALGKRCNLHFLGADHILCSFLYWFYDFGIASPTQLKLRDFLWYTVQTIR